MQPGTEEIVKRIGPNVMLFPSKNEAEASDEIITCIILVCDQIDNVLFDPVSTYYYVSSKFTSEFYMVCDIFDALIHVSTPVR